MSPFVLLYLPATAALLFKLYLLVYAREVFFSKEKNPAAKSLLGVLLALTACNAIELYGYRCVARPEVCPLVLLRIYYVSLVMAGAFLLQFSFNRYRQQAISHDGSGEFRHRHPGLRTAAGDR